MGHKQQIIQQVEEISKQLQQMKMDLELLKKSNPSQVEKIYTRKDIMEKFKISGVTLWKRMYDGSINFQKIGRKVIFRESDVINALNNRK